MAGVGRPAVATIVVLLTTLSGSLQLVRFRPPRLMPAGDQVVLEPGDTLRVRCEGSHPVTWRYSSLAQPAKARTALIFDVGARTTVVDISARVTIKDGGVQANLQYPFVSHIEIRDVTYLDVGYQSCLFNGTDTLDVVQNVTQIYLFVRDRKHLLAKTSDLQFLTVTQNTEAILPCRPTNPEVKVTLYKDQVEVTDLAARAMVYRRTEGFVIHSPVLTYHNGEFVCKAEYAGAKDRLRIFTRFNPSTDTVQKPWIDSADAQNAVLEGNFSLECRVHHQPGMFHTLTWRVPDASTGIKKGRIVQLPQEIELPHSIPGGQTTTHADLRRLLVTGTRVEDEGYYTCYVQNQNGLNNSRREFIAIHDSNVATVKLTTDTTKFTTRPGETVQIVVNINAHPIPEIMWFNPHDAEISDESPLKYDVSVQDEQTILKIFDLRLEDMGEYRVTASSADGIATDSLTFQVSVQAAPLVTLETGRWFFRADADAVLACDIAGWPTPVVSWQFAYCPGRIGCNQQPFRQVQSEGTWNMETENVTMPVEWLTISYLMVTATKSGHYRCTAKNTLSASVSATTAFFVSDVDDGFGILPAPTLVVEGDTVIETCVGSKFLLDGVSRLSWLWSDSGTGQLTPVTDDTSLGTRVTSRETEHSYQKVLELSDIALERTGRYVCSAVNVFGEENRTDILLTVRAKASPSFLPDANMDESATITLEEGIRGDLNCTVSGQPPPQVTWTKDGKPLDLDDNGRLQLLADGQRLLISAAISDDAGNYQCRAVNRVGSLLGSAVVEVPGSGGANTGVIIGVTVVMVLILIALAACLVWKIRQQKNLQQRLTRTEIEAFTNGRMAQFNPTMPIDEQAELLPYDDEWEFPKERLNLGRQIGSGAFGRVLKAEATGLLANEPTTTVAVKMPKSGSDPNQIRSMMAELKIMIQLGKHLNVVNLLGAVTKHADQGEFMVLVEYCRHGNLHQYLQRHKTCFVNQVDPISGEYDASLGEEEYEATLLAGPISENTPLTLATLERGRLRLMTASHGSHYQRPRRTNSNASSLNSTAFNTDGTTADATCYSPAATVHEDSLGVPRLNTGTSLRPRRTPLTTRDLLRWSYQVARGMEYLASRKLLHGDLAARNILLAENNIVKISDFGLSRDIYKTRDYKKKGKGLLPVKWMAIESIQESIFSTQSDVWSFGVVMWELFSLGGCPYPGMEYDVNFVRRLRDGYRMEMPKFSPLSVYRLMLECWARSPSDRPTFSETADKLGHFLEERVRQEYVLLNEPYNAMNDQYFAQRTDYVTQLVSPDYSNVTGGSDDDAGKPPYINVDPQRQSAGFTAGQGDSPVRTGTDGYLMMTPDVDADSTAIFSPRPTAVVKPQSRFEFPADGRPPSHHFNSSYDEAAKVPSTPKMGTRASRGSRQSGQPTPAEDTDHYLVPLDFGSAV